MGFVSGLFNGYLTGHCASCLDRFFVGHDAFQRQVDHCDLFQCANVSTHGRCGADTLPDAIPERAYGGLASAVYSTCHDYRPGFIVFSNSGLHEPLGFSESGSKSLGDLADLGSVKTQSDVYAGFRGTFCSVGNSCSRIWENYI